MLAGNRVSQSVGRNHPRFGYNPAGQTTQVSGATTLIRDAVGVLADFDWLAQHSTAQGSICGVLLCVAFGPSMVGIGPALKVGVEVSVGATTRDKTSGLGVQGSCSAALGPGGVYVDYSRHLAGRQNVGGGYAAGASLGCSGLIVWTW